MMTGTRINHSFKVSKHLPSSMSCYEGDSITLECKFTLTEEQEPCEWFHESELIQFPNYPKNPIYENNSDGVRRKLTIKAAELDHSGLYICKCGDFTTETILEVDPRPPQFNLEFRPAEVRLGENCLFKCETDKPEVNVLWMKNGVEIEESKKHIIIWDGCDHSLEIVNVGIEDQAEYSLVEKFFIKSP